MPSLMPVSNGDTYYFSLLNGSFFLYIFFAFFIHQSPFHISREYRNHLGLQNTDIRHAQIRQNDIYIAILFNLHLHLNMYILLLDEVTLQKHLSLFFIFFFYSGNTSALLLTLIFTKKCYRRINNIYICMQQPLQSYN